MAKVLRGILSLFGARQTPRAAVVDAPRVNPVAIPPPENYPTDLLHRVPERQPRPSHRKGKRRTPEEIAADRAAFAAGMKAQAVQRFEFERGRAEEIGVTHYRWRTCRDGSVCKVCAKREGKKFPYRAAADFLHPGLVDCCNEGYCRCHGEVILPD